MADDVVDITSDAEVDLTTMSSDDSGEWEQDS